MKSLARRSPLTRPHRQKTRRLLHAGITALALASLLSTSGTAIADQRSADWDRDGIRNDQDLWPRGAELPGTGFLPWYPAGALRQERDAIAIGLTGRSRVERWGSKGWKFWKLGWHEEYSGTKGTRQSELSPDWVRAAVDEGYEDAGWRSISARRRGPGPVSAEIPYSKQQLHKRYTLDYSLRSERFSVTLENHKTVRMDDAEGRPLYTRTVDVALARRLAQDVVVQFSVRQEGWRRHSQGYLPAFSYRVYPLGRVSGRALTEGLAVGAPLEGAAYEARIRLDASVAARAAGRVSILLTAIWVRMGDDRKIEHRAIDARLLQVGAWGMEWIVAAQSRRDGTQHIGLIGTSFRDASRLLHDPTQVLRDARRLRLEHQEALVMTKKSSGGVETRLVTQAKKYSILPQRVVWSLDNTSKVVFRKGTKDIISGRFGDRGGVHYERVSRAVHGGFRGTVGVIQANEAFVAWKQGDHIKMTLFGTQAGLTGLWAVGSGTLGKVGGAASWGVGSVYQSVLAFKDGRRVEGLLHLGKTPLWGLWFFGGETAVHSRLPSMLNVAFAARLAVTSIDVAIQLHSAFRSRDAIKRQGHFEAAAATAINTGIMCIPTVGLPLVYAWMNVAALVSLIKPDSLYVKIFASPGSVIVHFGTVIFTNAIPSVISEDAFRKAVKRAEEMASKLRERGKVAVVVVPSPGIEKRRREIQRRR